jgi:pyruvate/2-oxoglutarate dehydrogenase complex dihydrolipoamide dehydrogenase (E3) component
MTIATGRSAVQRSTIHSGDDAVRGLVHPEDWVNPTPADRYDLVVIGGGTAGLVSAMGAAGLGARVALVERHLLGGDCLNTGCVPSKAIIRSARVVGELRRAASLGVRAAGVEVDFGAVMRRMRERRASVAVNDSAERLRHAGVDVFFGPARFADPATVLVDGARLRFTRAVIATGGRPAAAAIPGLESVDYLTSENIFDLSILPKRLIVLGAGPIGCELAQAFARFGSRVTVLDRSQQILPNDDGDASAVLRARLADEGIHFALAVRVDGVRRVGDEVFVDYSQEGAAKENGLTVSGDTLLVATGRAPNIEGLHLDAAGIGSNKNGVEVSDHLRTTNRRVYAAGDVCSSYKFTHAADAMARIVLQNALFYGRRKASALVIPWVTYTDPEVAHVGVSLRDATRGGDRVATVTIPLSEVDRAMVDDETDGFVRVHHERGRIRGCTIVAPHAGEMIGEAVYALSHGGTLSGLSATVHPYPSYAEALRKAGDLYRRQSVTPAVKRWLERYFRWTR